MRDKESMDKHLANQVTPLNLIATALVQLTRNSDRNTYLHAPYPTTLQRGLDLLTVEASFKKLRPPESIFEVLDWCQARPLSQWPIDFEGREMADDAFLLSNGRPTTWCEELALIASDVEDEVTENRVMRDALNVCKSAESPQLYVEFRRLLIEKPVLMQLEFLRESRRLQKLAPVLSDAYEIAPDACCHAGKFTSCGRCGSLLVLDEKGVLCCEDSSCRAEGPLKTGKEWQGSVLQLKRSLRRFVTNPGLVELRLYRALLKRGVEVELWPDFDAYDLKITVNNKIWAIDVKDWANPFLLARSINEKGPFRKSLASAWDEAFWVFPNARRRRRNYLAAFKNTCHHLHPNVTAVFEADFLRRMLR